MLLIIAEPDQHAAFPFEQAAKDSRLDAKCVPVPKRSLNPFARLDLDSDLVGLGAVVDRDADRLADLEALPEKIKRRHHVLDATRDLILGVLGRVARSGQITFIENGEPPSTVENDVGFLVSAPFVNLLRNPFGAEGLGIEERMELVPNIEEQ